MWLTEKLPTSPLRLRSFLLRKLISSNSDSRLAAEAESILMLLKCLNVDSLSDVLNVCQQRVLLHHQLIPLHQELYQPLV